MAEGNQPVRHHYVPKWLLRRFCSEQGKLWWKLREWSPEKVHPRSLESVFFGNHLNTLYADDGTKDPRVETALAKLDRDLSDITDRLVRQGRRGDLPDLEEESRDRLYRYMFVQYKRSPDLHAEEHWPHNARVAALLEPSEEVSRVLGTKGLCLLSAPPGSALVVGSRVVLRASAGQAGPLEDAAQGLAFDVLLCLVHDSSRREHGVLTTDEVVSNNRRTAAYCQEVAGPDRETVRRAVS